MSHGTRKPTYHALENGYIIPKGHVKEFQSSLTYTPEPRDVFICTYPKCGTTWTQNILYLMLNNGDSLQPEQSIHQFIPSLEKVGKEAIPTFPKPRVIKTHLPYSMLPKSELAKYIVVVRNPKDCCVSFYFHTKGFVKIYDFADGEFEDYFDLFMAGEVDFGDYFDHLLSYLPQKNDPNMLFLLYEEMKSDTERCIVKIGEFLGQPFCKSCEDSAILEKVVRNSGFEAMKATPMAWSPEQAKGCPGFIREGEVGGWKTHFTQEQSRKMDEKIKIKLAGTEAEHFWDKYNC